MDTGKNGASNGVDLVFELPYAFATAHARFAKGAIQLLDAVIAVHIVLEARMERYSHLK